MMHTAKHYLCNNVFHSKQSIKIGMLNDSIANYSIDLSAQALHHAMSECLIGRVENYTLHL